MSNPTNRHTRVRLTVAMIVRDEQETLAATLDSVRGLADEVIVVDTGSSDDTRQIAARHATQVVDRPWDDDFSAARNAGLAAASGDFILWLDAGERLAPDAVGPLRQFIDAQADPNKVYGLPVEFPPAEPHGSTEEVARIRLMPRSSGLRFTGRVLESVRPTAAALGMASELLTWRIARGQRDQQPQVKAQRALRNLRLIELEASESGLDGRLLIGRAEALATLGDRAAAALDFHRAIRTSPRGSLEMLEAYYGLLGSLDGNPACRDQQLAICLEALEIYPIDTQLLCVMGGYMQQQERLDLAARAFRLAVEHGRVEPEIWRLSDIAEVALSCLVATLELQGEEPQAQALLEDAVRTSPRSPRLRRLLTNLHIKHARVDEALAQLAQWDLDVSRCASLRGAVRGACLCVQQNWIPAWSHLWTAYEAGCRDPICLRWLAVTLLFDRPKTSRRADSSTMATDRAAQRGSPRLPGRDWGRAGRNARGGGAVGRGLAGVDRQAARRRKSHAGRRPFLQPRRPAAAPRSTRVPTDSRPHSRFRASGPKPSRGSHSLPRPSSQGAPRRKILRTVDLTSPGGDLGFDCRPSDPQGARPAQT